MRRTSSRFLVVLYALLQCVAPLLHAHAHAGEHFGVHLVHLHGWGETHGHAHDKDWAVAQPADDEAVVGLSPGLQPRPDPGHALPGGLGRHPGLPRTQGGLGVLPVSPEPLPGPPRHLIPLPGPPPTL